MITFVVSTLTLVLAYVWYGAFLDRTLGIDEHRKTPAETKFDGVDFVPISWPRCFLIQLLNIAGLGPVFGAVLGALWGPVAFLWIVLGGIFIGGVHDFVAAHVSLREGGLGLPEIIGKYLGPHIRKVMVALTLVLLIVVGVLFVMGPARIMADLCQTGKVESTAALDGAVAQTPVASVAVTLPGAPVPLYATLNFWAVLIFLYYFLATMLPIDQVIARVYPLFGACLLAMVGMLSFQILNGTLPVPELSLANLHPAGKPIWPLMMITIACGAVSGFHATQSPMMARTLTSEKYSRRVFFGAMLCESFVALVWAAAALGLVKGSTTALLTAMGPKIEAVLVVKTVALGLGPVGLVLALLGVVALPVTTGDTAFRAARLIIGEGLTLDQKPIRNRLLICVPMFALGIYLCQMDFGLLWQYLSWLNQGLAAFTLWAGTVYLWQNGRNYFVTMIPAIFMTIVGIAYIFIEGKIGFGLSQTTGTLIALGLGLTISFFAIPRGKPALANG